MNRPRSWVVCTVGKPWQLPMNRPAEPADWKVCVTAQRWFMVAMGDFEIVEPSYEPPWFMVRAHGSAAVEASHESSRQSWLARIWLSAHLSFRLTVRRFLLFLGHPELL